LPSQLTIRSLLIRPLGHRKTAAIIASIFAARSWTGVDAALHWAHLRRYRLSGDARRASGCQHWSLALRDRQEQRTAQIRRVFLNVDEAAWPGSAAIADLRAILNDTRTVAAFVRLA